MIAHQTTTSSIIIITAMFRVCAGVQPILVFYFGVGHGYEIEECLKLVFLIINECIFFLYI